MEEELRQDPSDRLRICVFGPESTGKSTLSRKLSQHYNAPLVTEFARTYLQELWDTHKKVCRPKDILPIARGQIMLENNALNKGNKLIICDTDLLTTEIYSKFYYNGWSPEVLTRAVEKNKYDLYLLTYIDTPWTPDDLRDQPHNRTLMFNLFKNALETQNKPFIILKGDQKTRINTAITAINKL